MAAALSVSQPEQPASSPPECGGEERGKAWGQPPPSLRGSDEGSFHSGPVCRTPVLCPYISVHCLTLNCLGGDRVSTGFRAYFLSPTLPIPGRKNILKSTQEIWKNIHGKCVLCVYGFQLLFQNKLIFFFCMIYLKSRGTERDQDRPPLVHSSDACNS